jgi:hypothetical protein
MDGEGELLPQTLCERTCSYGFACDEVLFDKRQGLSL